MKPISEMVYFHYLPKLYIGFKVSYIYELEVIWDFHRSSQKHKEVKLLRKI